MIFIPMRCMQCKTTTTNFWLVATTRFSVMTSVVYILSGLMLASLVLNGNPFSRVLVIDSETESEEFWRQVATPLVSLVTVTGFMFVTFVNDKWLPFTVTFYLHMVMIGYGCLCIRIMEVDRLVNLLTGPVFVVVFGLGSWVERMIEKNGPVCILIGVVFTALPALYVLGVLPRPARVFISLLIAIYYCTKTCVSCNFSPASSALRDKIESLKSRLVEITMETTLCRLNNFYLVVMGGNMIIFTIGGLNPDLEVLPR